VPRATYVLPAREWVLPILSRAAYTLSLHLSRTYGQTAELGCRWRWEKDAQGTWLYWTIGLPFDRGTLDVMLAALQEVNLGWLREHPETPSIYHAGVRYIRENVRQERWASIPDVMRRGGGDCEDLAAWLAAEKQFYGTHDALAFSTKMRPGLWHIRVKTQSTGAIEDPSRALGMRAA
jgi:hypothetical protein